MNCLFFGHYNQENISLCRNLCKNGFSFCGLYENENLKKINVDFMSMGFQSDPFFDKVYVIESNPQSENVVNKIEHMIIQYSFSPDVIITRGRTEDLWPIASLIVSGDIVSPCIALVDDMPEKLCQYDSDVLGCFDSVIAMGGKDDSDFIKIFNNYDPSEFINYRDLNIPLEAFSNSVLFLTNSENFKELAGNGEIKREFISFVDVQKAPNRDICLYANVSQIVVDATGDPETPLIMSKMGKKIIPQERFDIKKVQFSDNSYEFLEDYKTNMSYFSAFINKEIVRELKNLQDKRNFSVKGEVVEIKEI